MQSLSFLNFTVFALGVSYIDTRRAKTAISMYDTPRKPIEKFYLGFPQVSHLRFPSAFNCSGVLPKAKYREWPPKDEASRKLALGLAAHLIAFTNLLPLEVNDEKPISPLAARRTSFMMSSEEIFHQGVILLCAH